MKFKAGDLVTYKDFKTQAGHFEGCSVLLVLGTGVVDFPRAGTHVHLHHLKTGGKGWDWADGYVKIPSGRPVK
tara:strand:+ start:47 stop:265 length:219 start_codon:yes stop_codon:yes gene_type:complete